MRLLRRARSLIETVDPEKPDIRSEWLVARIRLSSTLSALTAESSGPSAGLDGLAEVRRLVEHVGDPLVKEELAGGVEHNRGLLLLNAGLIDDAITLSDAALVHYERRLAAGEPTPALAEMIVKSLWSRGTASTRLGLIGHAREDLTRAAALAGEHGLLDRAADASHSLGLLDLRVGDVPAALRRYESSERAYRDQDLEVPVLLGLHRAQALLAAGMADEAGGQLDGMLPEMRADHSITRNLADVELYRAAAAYMTDDLDLARAMAAGARRRMRRWGCETCVANATLVGLRVDTRLALRSGATPRSLPRRALA
ncbi:MAG: hypothetical protein HOV94_10745, partial [Saccharothrix sp.]|nr:hypothetical protein [Saccharothrix sp.]